MNDKNSESSGVLPSILSDILVLDVTNVLAGPFATYTLSLLGARIIKVEQLEGGDLARSLGGSPEGNRKLMGTSFVAQNCNKESVALDLKSEEGREVFRRLVDRSDILVENFRPGVMTRLGLGYENLRQRRPELVYCAISGYGQDGPEAGNPAYDQIIQGKSGLMAVTGEEGGEALRCGFPIADTVGGLNAVLGIICALYQRQTSGQGQYVDVALLDSLLPMMGWVASNYLQAGIPPQRFGNENFTAAPSGVFETAAGKLNIAANKQEQWEALCRILDLEELIADPRFCEREVRKANRYQLRLLLNDKLARRSARAWAQILNQQGIPSGEVLALEEALSQPQVEHRGLLRQFDDSELGRCTVFGLPLKFSAAAQVEAPLTAPPRLGEHTRPILSELGYTADEVRILAERGVIRIKD
jgi:crotonobetainyl-CoA:carnitine CoA-transferase CaiB-like acyl-CoA transferase